MDYWYIWYEIYEDGKLIPNSKSRYTIAYEHKSSAVRRARQMWSNDLYNPMTDTTISRKWVVSQTNPWEDVYIFSTRADAENAIVMMRELARRYGVVTRADLLDLKGNRTNNLLDTQFGWIDSVLERTTITPRRCGYSTFLVEFPRAVDLGLKGE